MLRLITDGAISPEEAVRAYHGVLQAKKIKPKLPLEKDLELTDQAMSYEGSGAGGANVTFRSNPLPDAGSASVSANGDGTAWPRRQDGSPDFDKMNSAQRGAYDLSRLTRKYG